ncbi:hypothetical protein K7X08_036688 [Anisodus acutangulus]|uniref:Uncharacterized protein n=1 Tax=Anisodus acutangulus TaxID=402998 RepID=A0A9Q1L5S5_9SOLA|nr:hypothetical protein K7X08_036688 [Anisodus acutangulus]
MGQIPVLMDDAWTLEAKKMVKLLIFSGAYTGEDAAWDFSDAEHPPLWTWWSLLINLYKDFELETVVSPWSVFVSFGL